MALDRSYGMALGWPRGPGQVVASPPAYLALPSYASLAAFGDSITVGYNASTAANNWASKLASALGATLLNSGQPGTVLQNSPDASGASRSLNGRNRVSPDVLGANKKAAAFVAYGFNDARYIGSPGTLNVPNYLNDLRETLGLLMVGGYSASEIYVASPYYITDQGLLSYGTDSNFSGQSRAGFEAYVLAAASVAVEYGVRYCDLYSILRDNAFRTTIDTDNIHPLNAGHQLIADAWLSRTYAASVLSRPSSVTLGASGTTVTVTAQAVAGAVGYDYGVVDDNGFLRGQGSSASFAGLPAGKYYGRARAVFPSGTPGPWAFSTTSVTIATGIFARDLFDAPDATSVAYGAHTPDVGYVWWTSTAATSQLVASGRLYSLDGTAVMSFRTLPPNANYYVEAGLTAVSALAGDNAGVAGRLTDDYANMYFARFSRTAGGWQLFKTVAGASSQLGATFTDAFTSGSRRVRLSMIGTTISMSVDINDSNGLVSRASVTDGSLTGAGSAGLRLPMVASATTGVQVDDFLAGTL